MYYFKSCILFMCIDRYLGWLHFLANVTWMPIKTDNASISPLGLLPRPVLTASSMFSLKNLHTDFHSGCINAKSLQHKLKLKFQEELPSEERTIVSFIFDSC